MILPNPSPIPRPTVRPLGRLLVATGLLLGVALPAASENGASENGNARATENQVLAQDGTVFRLVPVPLPDPLEGSSSLVLQTIQGDGLVHQETVPGTGDATAERWATISYADESSTVTVLWEDVINDLHSTIEIAQYRQDSGWILQQAIVGSPFYKKSRPTVASVSDRLAPLGEEGGPPATDVAEIKVSHLIWREDQGQVFYSNMVEGGPVDDGMSVSSTVSLNELLDLPLHDEWQVDGPLAFGPGRDHRSSILAFVDPLTGSLEIVEIRLLPLPVSQLADAGYRTVLDAVAEGGDLVSVAEEARSHIVRVGRSQPGVAPQLAEAAAAAVLGSSDGLVGIAEGARSHIVRVGLRLNADLQSERSFALLSRPLGASSDHHVDIAVRHVRSFPLPGGLPEEFDIAPSPDGERVLLYWFVDVHDAGAEGEEAIAFVETNADGGWYPVSFLHEADQISLDQAERLVRSRVELGS